MVVGACQRYNFSDKKPGFLEIIDLCLNVGIGFCTTWLVLPNREKNKSKNVNFNLTMWATLSNIESHFESLNTLNLPNI